MQFTSDDRLNEKLSDWHSLLDRLKPIEEKYLLAEGMEDTLFGRLFLNCQGSTVAVKEALVHASDEFSEFKKSLAVLKSEYLDCKRRVDLRIKAFESEYLTMKLEAEAIKKHR